MSQLLRIVHEPLFQRMLLAFALTGAAQGLVAVWAATSRIHWFWRALAVWAGILALAPIRVYEPAIIFSISSPLTVALILAARRLRGRRALRLNAEPLERDTAPFRFALKDLFLLVLLVGLVIVGLRALDAGRAGNAWLAYLVCGAFQAAVVTLAYRLIANRGRWLSGLLLVATIVGAGFAIPLVSAQWPDALPWQSIDFDSAFSLDQWFTVVLFHATQALLVAVVMALVAAGHESGPAWRRVLSRCALAALFVRWSIPLTYLYWQMYWLSPLPPPIAETTSHYDQIVAIARRLEVLGAVSGDPARQLEHDRLIDEVVDLLDADNFVPYDPAAERSVKQFDQLRLRAVTLRDLGRKLDGESKLATFVGDHNRATKLSLAILRLGSMLTRGAESIEGLLGIEKDSGALQRLIETRGEMSNDQLRAVIDALARAAAQREDAATISARDAAVTERAIGWRARLDNVLLKSMGWPSPVGQALKSAMRRILAEENLLKADLAIRLFDRDHHRPPHELDELVPAYLTAVPLDPFSASPLRYRVTDGQPLLYSVGIDRIDNGGRLGNFREYFTPGYDLDLDTWTRP